MPQSPRAGSGPKRAGAAKPPDRRPVRTGAGAGVLGALERVDADGTVEGWCWSPEHPNAHRTVAVTIDGHVVARAACNRPRRDLAEAARGNGEHGFLVRLAPAALRPGAAAEIALRDVASGQLVGAPQRVIWGNGAAASGPAEGLSGHLDRVTRDGWVSGWCWDPQHPGRRLMLDVLVDGHVVGTTQASNWRGDLQEAGVGDGCHGFSYALPYEVMAAKGTLRIAVRESGGGPMLGTPAVLRIGLKAEAEERVAGLERDIRLLRAKLDTLQKQAEDQPVAEERAARALFATVATFFRELADGTPEAERSFGTGRSLRATLDDLLARLPSLGLRQPETIEQVKALVIVPATQPIEIVHRCLSDLNAAGVDLDADIVVLDPGDVDPHNTLLPGLVRALRYDHCGADTLPAVCNAAMRRHLAPLTVLVDPRVTLLPDGWRALLQGVPDEPRPAVLAAPVLRGDGLLQHAGLSLAGGRVRELAQFAAPETGRRNSL